MWTPTHVQVTVRRAKGLLCKGKDGTNDVFVIIKLAKEKYQTSVKNRATDPVEWHEKCELSMPEEISTAKVVLKTFHRNFLGDQFLGQVSIPLIDFEVHGKPTAKWYQLSSKPGFKNMERGELEVRIGFTGRSGPKGIQKPRENEMSAKETLSAVFQPKPTVSKYLDDEHGSKGTPVGITSPMMKETAADLKIPSEAIARFEGKSQEDLIAMVLGLEATVDSEKQKLKDMENYIDKIVRVVETKPAV